MSECDKCKRQLSAYIDNELGEDEKQKIISHIASCKGCKEILNGLTSVRDTLTTLPKHKTSPTFNTVLQAQLRREMRLEDPKPIQFLKGFFRVPAYAAMAVIFIAAGIFLDRSFFMEQTTRSAGIADITLQIEEAPVKDISEAEKTEDSRVLKNYVIVNEQFSSQEQNLSRRSSAADSDYQTTNRPSYPRSATGTSSRSQSGFRVQQASLETVEF